MSDPVDQTLRAIAALSRQNGAMPSRREPSESMPHPARTAHIAIAGPARLESLRFLISHPGSTRADLVEGTGIGTNTARAALTELEELGYVTGDRPLESRNGRTVHYTADRELLLSHLQSLLAYIID